MTPQDEVREQLAERVIRVGRMRDGCIEPGELHSLTDDGVTTGIGLMLAGAGPAGNCCVRSPHDADNVVRHLFLLPDQDVIGDLIGQVLLTAGALGMSTVVDRARKQLAYVDEHRPLP